MAIAWQFYETQWNAVGERRKISTLFISLLREISTRNIAVHTTYDLYCYPKYWKAHIRERVLERDDDGLETVFPENWLVHFVRCERTADKEQM